MLQSADPVNYLHGIANSKGLLIHSLWIYQNILIWFKKQPAIDELGSSIFHKHRLETFWFFWVGFLVYKTSKLYIFNFIGEWRPTRSYCIVKSFSVQVIVLWSVLCIPGNVVTTYLYHTSNNNSITTLQESVENISSLKCHEQRSNWNHTVSTTRFALEGIVSCSEVSCMDNHLVT